MLKKILLAICLVIVIFILGPRPHGTMEVNFTADRLGDDLDSYLKAGEARFDDIRDGLEKEIIWANPESNSKTDWAIIYLHGFSASRVETAPVPQNVARALDANLYFARLGGHGRTGKALAQATLQGWTDDVSEALAIGKKIGNRTLLVSTSTGGSLSVWAAHHPDLSASIDGLVLISTNFAVQALPTAVMNMPWAEWLLPVLGGKTRSWEPLNEKHATGWTTTYPSSAVFPMAVLLKTIDAIDLSKIRKPALFIYSNKDKVIVPQRIKDAVENWGGDATSVVIDDSENRNNHVIAGDILSPNTTKRTTDVIVQWSKKL